MTAIQKMVFSIMIITITIMISKLIELIIISITSLVIMITSYVIMIIILKSTTVSIAGNVSMNNGRIQNNV